ncbi:MAG: zinc ribbon domain-containing protein [Gammaproteobacteria bacterium]
MPFYEYQCTACKHRLEALQKFSDEPLVECPACGAAALQRLMSAPAFRLKGGGWYETDFKSDNKRHLAEGSDAKPVEKSDTKPVDSTPAKP